MTIVIGLAIMAGGLAIGFIIAWALGMGASMGLAVGILLVVAGAVVGFVSEWLIDEAYRKNRELRRQLGERGNVSLASALHTDAGSSDTASETLADFLRRRDEELSELRKQLVEMDAKSDTLQDEFDTYQRTHPDDLTVIKGIGAVYQWKLRDAGFNTYKQLSEANPDQLRRMLDVKNWQRVNVEAWIDQARDWMQRGS